MIVLLNGMLGSHVEHIAKIVALQLNVDNTGRMKYNYSIDENNSFNISNTIDGIEGNYYHDETQPNENEIPASEIKSFSDSINNLDIKYLYSKFLNSYLFDYNLSKYVDYTLHGEMYAPENITNEDGKYNVICGQISKYYIDKLIEVHGKENVIVINITRNPTISSFVYNSLFKDYKEETIEMDCDNACSLSNLTYVSTIKFEYIIKNKKITIDGKDILFSNDFGTTNNYLANFEYKNENIKKSFDDKSFDYNDSNILFSNLNIIKSTYVGSSLDSWYSEAIKVGKTKDDVDKKIDSYAINVFDKLNYNKFV